MKVLFSACALLAALASLPQSIATSSNKHSSAFSVIEPPQNDYTNDQLRVHPAFLVKTRAMGDIRPANNIPLEHCNDKETAVLRALSTIVITDDKTGAAVTNKVEALAYVSCLKATGDDYLYDVQIFDVSLQTIDNKKKEKVTKIDNKAFKYATRFIRTSKGTVTSIFVDRRETRDILRIKKTIIQGLQTQLVYSGGTSTAVEKDSLSEHSAKYYAVKDYTTGRYHVESTYNKASVLKFANEATIDEDPDFDFTITSKAIFDNNSLKQQLSRTMAKNSQGTSIVAGGDTTFLYSLPRIPSSTSKEFETLFGLFTKLFFRGNTYLHIDLTIVDDSKNKRKISVPRTMSLLQSSTIGAESILSLESFMNESDMLFSPPHQRRQLSTRDVDADALVKNIRDNADDSSITALSLAARNDPSVGNVVLKHLKEAYISYKAAEKRNEDTKAQEHYIGALAAAVANSEVNAGHEYLLQLAKEGDDSARAALILNSGKTSEQFVMRASDELADDDANLIVASLVADKSPEFAHKVMSRRINYQYGEDNDEKKMLIVHTIQNMGANGVVFKHILDAINNDATTGKLVKREIPEATSAIFARGWWGTDPSKEVIHPQFNSTSDSYNWTATDAAHFLIASYTDRYRDTVEYPVHSSYVAYGNFGTGIMQLELAGGAFAGLKSTKCVENASKVFSRAIARISAFNQKIQLADIIILAYTTASDYKAKAIMKVMDKVIRSKSFQEECFDGSYPFGKIRTPLLSKTFYFPVYATIVDVSIALQGALAASLRFDTCNARQAAIAIIPELASSVVGSTGASIFEARVSVNVGGETSGAISPQASLGTIKGTDALSRVPGSNPIDEIHINATEISEVELQDTPIAEDAPNRFPFYNPFDGSIKRSESEVNFINTKLMNPFTNPFYKRDTVIPGKPIVSFPPTPPSKPKVDPKFDENEICRACVSLNFAFDPSDLVISGSIAIPMAPVYQHELYRIEFNQRKWGPIEGSVLCSDKDI